MPGLSWRPGTRPLRRKARQLATSFRWSRRPRSRPAARGGRPASPATRPGRLPGPWSPAATCQPAHLGALISDEAPRGAVWRSHAPYLVVELAAPLLQLLHRHIHDRHLQHVQRDADRGVVGDTAHPELPPHVGGHVGPFRAHPDEQRHLYEFGRPATSSVRYSMTPLTWSMSIVTSSEVMS